jgi:acyl-CoA dehydrogenase
MASLWITDELVALEEHSSRFFSRELAPRVAEWERNKRVDRETWRQAGEAGFLCASMPEEYGGGGGTLAHEAVLHLAACRAGLASSYAAGVSVSCGIVAHYILSYGTENQKRAWLPKLASGEWIAAIAMTEPGTGSNLQAIRTVAERVNGGYSISGQKTFISNGQMCDFVLVVTKTDPAAGSKGISLIGVETASCEGFKRGRLLEKIGMHAQDTSELFFDEAWVPEENLLGGVEAQGFVQLMQQLSWERLTIALTASGIIDRAIGLTTEYTRSREVFGQKLSEFQNSQFKLAECKAKAIVARALVDQFMMRILENSLSATDAAAAKLWATEALGQVVDECVQLHGGYGYMAEYEIARIYADVRVMRVYGGTSEVMKVILARSLD